MASRNEHTKKRRSSGKLRRTLGTIGLIILVTAALLACMAALYVKMVILPDAKLDLGDISPNLTTVVYYTDANGQDIELQKLHGTENRIWVGYDNIPTNLVDAAVAIEDKRFYKHDGVDWVRTAYGLISMFTGQDIQGGSTLTQQLIKNLTTENQVTVKRKIKEIFSALDFEKEHEKEEILEWYLNYIFLGEGCNGVYTASYAYFGKNVADLSLAECASLIGITNNPSLYNPYRNAEANKHRQTLILNAMLEQKKITKEEHTAALAETLQFVRGEDELREQTVYSWYVDAVIDQVIKDLREANNYSEQAAASRVYSGGLQIYTPYNPTVQAAVDAVYSDRANLNLTSASGQQAQSAITVVDNATGKVIALSGGIGKKDGSRWLNRASGTVRPPGSSIKPLTVYAPAFELGLLKPTDVERDSPDEKGWPVNAYGNYRGNMTIVEALEISCNTIAVKTLLNVVTPRVSFDFMRDRFHITLTENETIAGKEFTDIAPGPLALGGLTKGVSTYDMAAAYSVFARGGTYYEPSVYTKVLDSKGDIVLEKNGTGEVVLKPKTSHYINQLLERVILAGSGTGRYANFSGMQIAGKTGTTSQKKDIWFVGYTPYYTAAVWTGYDQQEAINYRGAPPSSLLWKQVMQAAHKGLPYKEFAVPTDGELVSVTYCRSTGLKAGSACGSTGKISLYAEDVPGSCTHRVSTPSTPKFDVNNPATWPSGDANFKPEDPSTWPTAPSTDGDATSPEGDTTVPPTTPTTPITPPAAGTTTP